MQPVYVITDAMHRPDAEKVVDRYVTGFWDGRELVASVSDAEFYDSVSEAEKVVRNGSFYDPAVREYQPGEDGMVAGAFFDMARYGRA